LFLEGYVVGVYPATAVMQPDKPMPIEAAPASEAAEEDDYAEEEEDH
jgi:hypothetical protein